MKNQIKDLLAKKMRNQNVLVQQSDLQKLPAATIGALKTYLADRLAVPPNEIIVSVYWSSRLVDDGVMASWAGYHEDSVLLTVDIGSMAAEQRETAAVSTQLTQLIDSVGAVPDAKAAENMLQMIADSLHELRISTFDAALGAAHRTRFRLFDEAQFSPRMLWPNDASPTGVIIQYSTIQPYMIYLPFAAAANDPSYGYTANRSADWPGAQSAFANLMPLYRSDDDSDAVQLIARPPAEIVSRILTPIIPLMDRLERTLDAVDPSYLLLLRQLTKHHVALLETGNRLYLFSIDLMLYIYMGQLREEAGSPILPFFALYRRISESLDAAGVSAADRHQPHLVLYYIYLCYIHWQGLCLGRDFAASLAVPDAADALDYIQHFIKTRILDVYYRAAPLRTTTRLLSQLARVPPLAIALGSSIKDNVARTKQRRYLLFRRENTRWYDQYVPGDETLRRMQIAAADAIASNLLLQFVNAHWQLSGTKLELRFPADETAAVRSRLWLVNPAAPNVFQEVHLIFYDAEAQVLLADVDAEGNVAEHHVIVIGIDQQAVLERRASEIRRAVADKNTKYDDAFYDKLHQFMEGVQLEMAKVAARDEALRQLDSQVREIQAALPTVRRSIDDVRALLQSLIDRQIVRDREADVFYDALEDAEAMETNVATPARLQSAVVQMAGTLLARTGAIATASAPHAMHNARVVYEYGSDMIRSALSAARALEDMVLQHGILPEMRRFVQDAEAARGALQYVVVPTLTVGRNAVILWFRGARKTAYLLVSNTAMAASESAPVLAEEATAAGKALQRAARAVRQRIDTDFALDFESIVNESDYLRPAESLDIPSAPIDPRLAGPIADNVTAFLSAVTDSFSALMRMPAQDAAPIEEAVGVVHDQRRGTTYSLIRGSDGALFFLMGGADGRKMFVRHPTTTDAHGRLHADLYRAYYDAPLGWRWIRGGASVHLHQRAWTTDVLAQTWLGVQVRAADLDYTDYYYVSADGKIVVVDDKDLMPPPMSSTTSPPPSTPPPPPARTVPRPVPLVTEVPASTTQPAPAATTQPAPVATPTAREIRRARRQEEYRDEILSRQRRGVPLSAGSRDDKSNKS